MERLEDRRVLNADFTLAANEIALDNFTDTDAVPNNEVLDISSDATGTRFILNDGIWSGTDQAGVVEGSGTDTLKLFDVAGINGLANGIIVEDSAPVGLDVSLGDVDLANLTGPLAFNDVGSIDQVGGTSITVGLLDIDQAGAFTMGALDLVGDLRLTTQGDLILSGQINATGLASLESTAGAIADDFDGSDILAPDVALRAATGIGDNAVLGPRAAIDLEADHAAFLNTTSGKVKIVNIGALSLGQVDGIAASESNGITDGGYVKTSSPLTINADVMLFADFTFDAAESAAAGDNLAIAAGVTITGAGGDTDITFNAGDNFTLPATATIDTDGSIVINGDDGNADAAGTIVEVQGMVMADNLTVNGDTDRDEFRIRVSSVTLITVHGGNPVDGDPGVPPGDILALDEAYGASVVPSNSPNGTVVTPGRMPVHFTSIETLILPDRFELNDTLATATGLGSEPFITRNDLSIHDTDDEDFFKYTAHDTGKLIVNAFFTNDIGDIDMFIQDSAGNLIAPSVTSTDNEQVIIPVVSQEMYFIRLFGFSDDDVNNYSLEIENFAAPAPAFVDLTSGSDTGPSHSDNITSDTTPTFLIQADLTDFSNMGIALLNQATIDPNNDGDAADATNDGAGVFVTLIDLGVGSTVEGFANQIGGSGILWIFTPSTPLADGEYFVSSAVQIVDGQQDPNRENDRAQLSDPLFITIATGDAVGQVSADMLDSSDTGMFNDDNVTNKMQPAFQGMAPVNSIVRLFANDQLVGQTVAGSDSSDVGVGAIDGIGGANNDGLGLWEITAEPLADDTYDIRLEIEDGAGNVTLFDPEFNAVDPNVDIVIDTEGPNTPLLDLQDDTGEDLHDEITSDNTPSMFMTTSDPNIALAQALFTDNLKFRIFDRFENNPETLVYDSAVDAAADNVATPGDMFTSLTALTRTLPIGGGVLVDGTHDFKLEVEDRAGNISEDFLLEVIIDSQAPAAVMPDLLDSSDSGMFIDDNVTNNWEPAFGEEAEINIKVFVYATKVDPATGLQVGGPILVGEGLVGSENSNDLPDDGLGLWEVTVEPLIEGVYDITVRFEDWAGNFTPLNDANNNSLRIVIDKTAPNTPFLELLDDSGRSDVDNITKENTPDVSMTTNDPNVQFAEVLFTDNLTFRIFDRFEETPEVLIYNSAVDLAADMISTNGDMFTSLTQLTRTLPSLGIFVDGSHNLKLEVEDRAGNISHDFLLEIIVDIVPPPVSFGLPDAVSEIDGLAAESDTGVTTVPETFADRITNDTTPRLWGRAEADAVIRVFHDRDADGIIDLTFDDFLGQTVAVPLDGNDAYPHGYWELTSALDLNQLAGMPKDGLRRLLVTAEDVAGNPMPTNDQIDLNVDALQIFIDTQGPRVNELRIGDNLAYDLFDPKPLEQGPTPLVNSLRIDFTDPPNRLNQAGVINDFLYVALVEGIAETPGNYLLVGDHLGTIAIDSVVLTNLAPSHGNRAEAFVELFFAAPLPDDRFTLTISDHLVDPANNHLDGESNTVEPQDHPTLPSGDGVPGGDFLARFTIDTRPEIGAYVAQNIDLDINGNLVWDPANSQIGNDTTNVDLSFTLPVANSDGSVGLGGYNVHDLVFAGKFFNTDVAAPTQFFDQLGAYGWSAELNARRWLIDTDSDGVVTQLPTDFLTIQPDINGLNVAGAIPVAGNFDNNPDNGDEIGLYNAGIWAFDFDRDFVIESFEVIGNNGLLGHPIVGDFDGDELDDLAVFNNNVFTFDFAFNGFSSADTSLVWGFPGVLDRPVAADMDQDGIDDIGLWTPGNSAQPDRLISEWHFLISNDFGAANRVEGTINTLDHPYETVPFGNDLYAEFGDELALPIVGNFDPPVAATMDPPDEEGIGDQSINETGDFINDGIVSGSDFLAWQRGFGMNASSGSEPGTDDGDGDHNDTVDGQDLAIWSASFGSNGTLVATDADFDGNDAVNSSDLTAWQIGFGTVAPDNHTNGDADHNGMVNGNDFLAWQRQFAVQPIVASAATLSEEPVVVRAVIASATPNEALSVVSSKEDPTVDWFAISSAFAMDLVPVANETAKEKIFNALGNSDVDAGADTQNMPLPVIFPVPGSDSSELELLEDENGDSGHWDQLFNEGEDFLHPRQHIHTAVSEKAAVGCKSQK